MTGYIAVECLTFKETAELFSKVVPFYISVSSIYINSNPSASLPSVGMVSLLNFSHSNKCVVIYVVANFAFSYY